MTSTFPSFQLDDRDLNYVTEFKYLGHLITNDECDDKDILREVRAMFTRTNILARRFSLCSLPVKLFCLEYFVYVSMVWSGGVVLLCVLLTGCGLVI